MNLATAGDARRAQRALPSSNHCLGNSDGEKEIGFANIVVVEKIHHVGAEVIGIEDPAEERDGHAELMFFIALAVESDESQVAGLCERQQRARSRNKRRSLIVVAVESAEGPVEMGYVESEAEARADRALGNSAGEVRGRMPAVSVSQGTGLN